MIYDELDSKALSRLSQTSRAIRQATIRPLFREMRSIHTPSHLDPFVRVSHLLRSLARDHPFLLNAYGLYDSDQPGSSLPRPYLERVTRLTLDSFKGTPCPYPAVSFPNLIHLRLNLNRPLNELSDPFRHFDKILPGLNPMHLSLSYTPYASDEERSFSFPTTNRIKTRTRLETITFIDIYDCEEMNVVGVLFEQYHLLCESMELIQGLPVVRDLKTKIVFDWRNFTTSLVGDEDQELKDQTIRILMKLRFPLVHLPSWMPFEIMIGSGPCRITKDQVEEWLGWYCPDSSVREGITVRKELEVRQEEYDGEWNLL